MKIREGIPGEHVKIQKKKMFGDRYGYQFRLLPLRVQRKVYLIAFFPHCILLSSSFWVTSKRKIKDISAIQYGMLTYILNNNKLGLPHFESGNNAKKYTVLAGKFIWPSLLFLKTKLV